LDALNLSILLPLHPPLLRGRYSTSSPYAMKTSFRCDEVAMTIIDKAADQLGMSRGLFLRLAGEAVASAVVYTSKPTEEIADGHDATPNDQVR